MRGAELSLAHSFSMENATQRGVFGKIFLRLAPGGARGDSFVRCHVKVIRLFRNFTPCTVVLSYPAAALTRLVRLRRAPGAGVGVGADGAGADGAGAGTGAGAGASRRVARDARP